MLLSVRFIIRAYLLRTHITLGTTSMSFDEVYEMFKCPHYEAANMSVKAGRPGQDQRFRRGCVA